MKLPDNSNAIIKSFTGISEERKAELCKHVAELPDESGMASVKQIIANGGPEAEFMSKVFGIPIPAKNDSPTNKSLPAPHTK